MKCLLITFIISLCGLVNLFAQNLNISGTIVENESLKALSNVSVSLINATNSEWIETTETDNKGGFRFKKAIGNRLYFIKTNLLAYQSIELRVETKDKDIILKPINLLIKENEIEEVLINAHPATAIQNGDTLEINANAFTTTKDASAEELIRKMPGIKIDKNSVTANGEEVKRVLIDGKDFFGEDASLALKNLPAEIIEKIQIFDKLSEQAQFSGFDDGMADKAINIVTRKDKQNGKFGQIYAGSDFQKKYLLGGNYNQFSKSTKLSVVGLINNVNILNFAQQDMLAITGSNKGKGDGGFSVNQQNGINTTRSLGINYISSFGRKLNVTGSYFVNSNLNQTSLVSLKDKFLFPRPDHYSSINDTTEGTKVSNRINLKFEYLLDSANTFVFIPTATIQSNSAEEAYAKLTTRLPDIFVNTNKYENKTNLVGFNIDNELIYKHKFSKPKRTLSISLNQISNSRDPRNAQVGFIKKSISEILNTNQISEGETNSNKYVSNIVYIEPLGEIGMLNFSLKNVFTSNSRSRKISAIDDQFIRLNSIDSLSNLFKSEYLNNHIGISYRIKSKRMKFSIGIEYQKSNLLALQTFPKKMELESKYENLLPEIQFSLKNTKYAFQLMYKTSTDAPGISQLQNQIDNSDKTSISTGNVNLKQEYIHQLTCKYSFANTANSLFYTVYLAADYKQNYIGTQIITAVRDTFIRDVGVLLYKNMDLTRPVNIDKFENLKSVFSLSFPMKLIKSKINISFGASYTQTPAYINSVINRYSLYSLLNGISISSDWGENLDFGLTYNVNINKVRNSLNTSSNELTNNMQFVSQEISSRITWVFWKGVIAQADLNYQKESGFLNYQKEYCLINLSLGKKIFKSQNGEIKMCIFDLPNMNQNYSHSVSPLYISDSQIKTISRYYMIKFIYTLRGFEKTKIKKKKLKNE